MDYNNIVAAKLNLTYNKSVFIKEYDEHILPGSTTILNGPKLKAVTAQTNLEWNMVPQDIYALGEVRGENYGKRIKTGYTSWVGCSLMYLDTPDDTLRQNSTGGSVAIRNYALDQMGEWKFYEKYEDLEITKFIKSLPLTNLIGIRCVSLQENTFAIIHRDDSMFLDTKNNFLEQQKMINNHIWASGFVQITINVSDGGVPLYYGVCDHLSADYKTINDDIYLFNDYVYHGVPLTDSRRRQIRITGRPTVDFADFINSTSIVNFKE